MAKSKSPTTLCVCGDARSAHTFSTSMQPRSGCACMQCRSDLIEVSESKCIDGCKCRGFKPVRLGWKVEITEHPRAKLKFWAHLVSRSRRELVGKYLDERAARAAAIRLAINMSLLNRVNRGKHDDEDEDY